jgi:hypothetical protein
LGKNALHAAAAFFIFALLGCVQTSIPPSCKNVGEGKLQSCIYEQAVLEQNPFYCYSISDTSARAACLKAAVDPVEKKKLQLNKQESWQGQGTIIPQQKKEEKKSEPARPPEPCEGLSGIDKDKCILGLAVEEKSLVECLKISDNSTKRSCISQVAYISKEPSLCENIPDKDLHDLCRAYSSGIS